ncbi:MAG TPA: hypothetical protein VJL58_00115, partial [Pyrinomonadaceae bacterium]|nr:hypothetical protein [Pyrinomonadaceae bacterium]
KTAEIRAKTAEIRAKTAEIRAKTAEIRAKTAVFGTKKWIFLSPFDRKSFYLLPDKVGSGNQRGEKLEPVFCLTESRA